MARLFPLGRVRSLIARRRRSGDADCGAAAGSVDPSLRRRVAVLACVLSVGMLAFVAPPVLADEDDRRDELAERKANLSDDLNDADSDLAETSAALLEASEALTSAQSRLSDAQQRLATTRGALTAARSLDEQMQSELAEAEQSLIDAENAVERTTARMAVIRDQIGDFVASSYQYGSPGLMSLGAVINGGNATELGENLALADSVVGAQAAVLDELAANEVLLQAEQERVEELRDEVALKRDAAAENLERKQLLTQQAVEQAADVRTIVATRSQIQQQAARAKQIELDRIARLEASREAVTEMLRRLAERNQPGPTVAVPVPASGSGGDDSTGGDDNTGGGDDSTGGGDDSTGGGDDSTGGGDDSTGGGGGGGYLSMPVDDTYVTSPFGMRMHPILRVYKLHDGTDLGAACGVPIYAAADGEVVSAYYDSAYGNRVILANGTIGGTSLSTSYNHLTSDTVAAGDSVTRGELIGYAGTTGYSTGCHLHFMVYESGEPTDPMDWLS